MSNEKQSYSETSIGFKLTVFVGIIVGIGAVLYGLSMLLDSRGQSGGSAVGTTRAGLNTAAAGNVTAEYASLAQKKFNEQVQQAAILAITDSKSPEVVSGVLGRCSRNCLESLCTLVGTTQGR